jgi:hypothetical protein
MYVHVAVVCGRLLVAVGVVAVVVVVRLLEPVEDFRVMLLDHHLFDGANPAASDDAEQASHSRGRRPRLAHRGAVVVACAGSEDARTDDLDLRVVMHLRVGG